MTRYPTARSSPHDIGLIGACHGKNRVRDLSCRRMRLGSSILLYVGASNVLADDAQ
jgi:hypothetical protein